MSRKSLVIGIVLVVSMALVITGVQLGSYSEKNTAATTDSSVVQKVKSLFYTNRAEKEKTFCLKDANNNDSINFSDRSELYLSSFIDCANSGGAPGLRIFFSEIPEETFSLDSEDENYDNLAASYYSTQQLNTTVDSQTQTGVKTINTTDTKTGPAPTDVKTQSYGSTYTNSAPVSSINRIAVVRGVPRNLNRAELSGVNADRRRAGIPSKKHKRGVYECTDFARDLEKTNPQKYTVTFAWCRIKVKCTDSSGKRRTYQIIGGHAFNDVHFPYFGLGYVEPQTGKNIDPDMDGDGKVSNAEAFHIPGVVEQLDVVLSERAPGCTDVEVSRPKCVIKSYENMVDAHKDSPPFFFNPGFNPN